MAQSLVGLDISFHTIKAVLFHPGGITGGRILAARTLDINACGGIDEALKNWPRTKDFPTIPALFHCRRLMSCSVKSTCLFTMITKSERHWLLN